MYTIRFHGRGGQGMKTASRLLGRAFFREGFEVQDAPLYGAERRGAPMTAYVRADREAIRQRGIIRQPGLVAVADDSLVPIPAAGVLNGISNETILLIVSYESAATWRIRLNLQGPILILTPLTETGHGKLPLISAACAGVAAALSGVISRDNLLAAIADELSALGQESLTANQEIAAQAFEQMAQQPERIAPSSTVSPDHYQKPAWIDLPVDAAILAAPAVYGTLTSAKVKTGLWRTQRPVIDYERCRRCWWVCSNFCPDSAIKLRADGSPEIDYEHCKGCMICVAQCPSHAITAIAEAEARQREEQQA